MNPRSEGTQRVQKLIAAAGFCSRRAAEELIAEGRVTVNHRSVKLGDKALPTDEIRIGNTLLPRAERFVYLAINKPTGYTCTLEDPHEKKTIARLIPVPERVYPVGRLDKDARGLLILTNDGEFANLLMHPRYEVNKTYIARLDKEYDTKHTEALRRGIMLRDGEVKAEVTRIAKDTVRVVVHEGRKHIVKRMLRKCGYNVRDLLRVAIGPLELDIKAGNVRPLVPNEIEALRGAAKTR